MHGQPNLPDGKLQSVWARGHLSKISVEATVIYYTYVHVPFRDSKRGLSTHLTYLHPEASWVSAASGANKTSSDRHHCKT